MLSIASPPSSNASGANGSWHADAQLSAFHSFLCIIKSRSKVRKYVWQIQYFSKTYQIEFVYSNLQFCQIMYFNYGHKRITENGFDYVIWRLIRNYGLKRSRRQIAFCTIRSSCSARLASFLDQEQNEAEAVVRLDNF